MHRHHAVLALGSTLVALSPSAVAQCEAHWSALGAGASGDVLALAVFDEDGAGPNPARLFVGGSFLSAGNIAGTGRIARWDGASWSAVGGGVGGTVHAMAVFDPDGAGSQPAALYVGGEFLSAANVANTARIARWTGSAWQAVGSGISGPVLALAVADPDGAGTQPAALFVGGSFLSAGGVNAARIARWNGSAWSALGAGASGDVYALAAADPDGSGSQQPALFAGGAFLSAGNLAGTSRIARWNGSAWSALGAGASGEVRVLAPFDPDGAGAQPAALIAGGSFLSMGNVAGTARIARWNGATWSALASGAGGDVRALAVADLDGPGPAAAGLFAAGSFLSVSNVPDTLRIAQWNGSAWSPAAGGLAGNALALASWDADAGGPAPESLLAGGAFLATSNNLQASRIARLAAGYGPTISKHPQSAAACPGTPVMFTVTASGSGALSYQWRRNGSNIAGATFNTYSISSVSSSDAGSYAVVVTGACGAITSESATLTVNAPVVITQQPQSLTVAAGAPAAFTVAATGTPPLSYQWRRGSTALSNGSGISGVTTPSLLINPAGTGHAGTYSVLVSNPCGAIPSAGALLTISCYANCDNSTALPILNVQDFTCFLQRFAGGESYANCDGSSTQPVLNVQDFTCFLQRYASGCP